MRLSKKIKDLRLSLGMTQLEFGAATGVNQSTVWRWERGESPREGPLLRLAKLAGVTVDDLINPPRGGMSRGRGPSIPADGWGGRMVQVTGHLAAGAWNEAVDWDPEVQRSVPYTGKQYQDAPMHAREIIGTSMNKVAPEGTVVFVVPSRHLGRGIKSGDLVAVQRTDESGQYEATLKEYVLDDNGRAWLWPRSDDPRHQEPLPYKKRGGTVTIVGVVIARFVEHS